METSHGCAELLRDADRRAAWMLLIDGIPQSHVDLDDPGYLEFEYVRRLGHIIDVTAPEGQPLHVLHLGAGALTLARYVAATRPGSRQVAVDVDEALWRFIKLRLPLRTGGRARVRIGDARAVLDRVPAGSFDLVITDVFAGGRTPAHLTSVEFAAAARRALRDSGVFAANVADGAPLAHARAQDRGVRDKAGVREDRPRRRDLPTPVRRSRRRGRSSRTPALSRTPRSCAAGGSATWCWRRAPVSSRPMR
jgi:spermidine synthase